MEVDGVHVLRCKHCSQIGVNKSTIGIIAGYLKPIDPYTEKVVQRRINSAHFVAKKNISLATFDDLVLLQEKNGTDMGQQHKGYHGVHIYTSLIAGSQLQQTTARLKQARLFGFLSDGTPGKHDYAEHESVYVLLF